MVAIDNAKVARVQLGDGREVVLHLRVNYLPFLTLLGECDRLNMMFVGMLHYAGDVGVFIGSEYFFLSRGQIEFAQLSRVAALAADEEHALTVVSKTSGAAAQRVIHSPFRDCAPFGIHRIPYIQRGSRSREDALGRTNAHVHIRHPADISFVI